MGDGKTKVLVVDDEVPFTRLLKRNLEEAGAYDVRVENKARCAHETAHQFRPDIIFMDVMMPDGSGGDVAALIEKDADLKDVPITFLTAAVRRAELGQSVGLIGGRCFMAKPVKLGELIAHITQRVTAS